MVNPLQVELQRLVRMAGEPHMAHASIRQIFDFQKRNPDFNIQSVLQHQSNYFRIYIERQLEIFRHKEGTFF